ncbi:hypothetical protein Ccrd_004208 [Cynara cardunculus var. scolymus]|uniref:Uncharacterized protein n=1 Tax=Cynara cardunculus var. scolymus TaxID=59895 RepID=A0A118JVH9_CYNCS|nr:hypothetical protein Ccrd_004208 [Cynara cardunculus var. scolymus]
MKGLIRLRSPGHEADVAEDEEDEEGGLSESDVEEHLEAERRLDHDLSIFEMIYPNCGVGDHSSYHFENIVADHTTSASFPGDLSLIKPFIEPYALTLHSSFTMSTKTSLDGENFGVGSTTAVRGNGENKDVMPLASFARMRKNVMFFGAKGVSSGLQSILLLQFLECRRIISSSTTNIVVVDTTNATHNCNSFPWKRRGVLEIDKEEERVSEDGQNMQSIEVATTRKRSFRKALQELKISGVSAKHFIDEDSTTVSQNETTGSATCLIHKKQKKQKHVTVIHPLGPAPTFSSSDSALSSSGFSGRSSSSSSLSLS